MLLLPMLFLLLTCNISISITKKKNTISIGLHTQSMFISYNYNKRGSIKKRNICSYCIKKTIKKNNFYDRCIITVKGGNGGDGICCFTTYSQKKNKKYASGGRGGNGGDIYLIGDKTIDNFYNLKLKASYYAGNGGKGYNNNQVGENGKNEYINVPMNTIIYNEQNEFINFIHANNQKVLVSKGGKGGKGNYSYRTKKLKIPFVCQYGEKTKEKKILLKKIFFTDFGIIGYPNVGKSTLLNKITNANIKIANYSYTSKFPNLGVFKYEHGTRLCSEDSAAIGVVSTEKNDGEHNVMGDVADDVVDDVANTVTNSELTRANYTVMDFPGIIKDLDKKTSNISYKYLEHLKYSNVLIYVFDINSNRDTIVESYHNIKNVLICYDQILKKKKEFILLNKLDIYIKDKDKKQNINELVNFLKKSLEVDNIFCISALTGDHVEETINEIVLKVNSNNDNINYNNSERNNVINEFIHTLPVPLDIEKAENSDYYPPLCYKIYKYDEHIYIIKGKYIENQANIFNFSKSDSAKVFNDILDELKVNLKLKNVGAREGDKIIISNYSYDFSPEY
ncbi:GTP-binding protein, putative [Hepatocystis sp. ex Piliocolobus tephrosceles]|nr:GTP-binding protein, putative [Hepatocystis sp. ex Piliocolobus tephrosceles]